MILSTIAEKLKRRLKDDFKGRQFEAGLIVRAVTWYLRYLLSDRDLEEMFAERGLAVDHSTIDRRVLTSRRHRSGSGCAGFADPIFRPCTPLAGSTRPT